MVRRKAAFIAITDEDDDQDKVTSYCPHCQDFGFNRIMKERIYPDGGPIPSDHENWLCCHSCGYLLPKSHSKRLDEITGIKEPDSNLNDYPGKVAIAVMNKKSSDRRRNFIKNLKRPDHSKGPEDKDTDLQSMLAKGKQLVSYTEEDNGPVQ